MTVSRYGALPYLAAANLTVIIGWSSDRTGERRFHIAGCLLIGALRVRLGCLRALAHGVHHGLCDRGHRLLQHDGPLLGLAHRVLGGQAAAGGVAIITMIGSLGGFAGPALTGKLKDLTHNYTAGLLTVGALAIVGAILCLFLKPASGKGTITNPADATLSPGEN